MEETDRDRDRDRDRDADTFRPIGALALEYLRKSAREAAATADPQTREKLGAIRSRSHFRATASPVRGCYGYRIAPMRN
jgi:hypothetical protein